MDIGKCEPCNGTGGVYVRADDPVLSRAYRLVARPAATRECRPCEGTGNVPPCLDCNGYGTADGLPAPISTYGALCVDACSTCGGTGNAKVAA